MTPHFADQSLAQVRCEWGLEGLRSIAATVDVIIIVDVLSFSTAVDVATQRGATILPYRWKDESAAVYERERDAQLAGPRAAGGFSLSPVSMLKATASDRIVLPSPNGATISAAAAEMGKLVLCGALRNATAVARYADKHGSTFAVIPAGERWPEGTLRPAVEDAAGAGAILAQLPGKRSPEAEAMVATWEAIRSDVRQMLRSCASGRQLVEAGYEQDVHLASEVDVSTSVPVLRGNGYRSAST